jgi:hypothetical protein
LVCNLVDGLLASASSGQNDMRLASNSLVPETVKHFGMRSNDYKFV